MLIVLGSQSEVKRVAVVKALSLLGIQAKVIAVPAQSGVNEQPVEGETLLGARNRAEYAACLVAEADLALAIESGLFWRDGGYQDIAIVAACLKSGELLQVESRGVAFPLDAVEEARQRGFDQWTVGKILAEWGCVATHNDPHLSLVGISRAEFVNEAVRCLFQQLVELRLVLAGN